MPRRSLHALAAVALAGGALLLVAAPAVAGPKRSAEAALGSLDGQAYRSVSSSTSVMTVRGADPRVTRLLSMRIRTAMASAVESPHRGTVTFTAGPQRGVRVVLYDGRLYVSRAGGPVRRAEGALRRYLVDVVFPEFGSGIIGAQALARRSRAVA
jgi:hypothetical protein